MSVGDNQPFCTNRRYALQKSHDRTGSVFTFFFGKESENKPYSGRTVILICLRKPVLFTPRATLYRLPTDYYCQRHQNKNLHYKGLHVHRIVRDLLVQMLMRQFRRPRLADSGISRFFMTLRSARWLNSRNAVFGRLIEGMVTLNVVTAMDRHDEAPKQLIQSQLPVCTF